MQIAINGTWGQFMLPEDYAAIKTNDWVYEDSEEVRCDPDLIDIVQSDDYDGDLEVVEIPDNATDYMISDYDGAETVYYVLDGKIRCIE